MNEPLDISNKEALLPDLLRKMPSYFSLYELAVNDNGDQDMRLLFANPAWLNIMNRTEETAFGYLFSELAPNDAAWIPVFADVARGNLETDITEFYTEEAKIHMHTELFSPKSGQVIVMTFDRTPFVKKEAEQEERENKVSTLFKLMPSGFCVCDLICDESGKPSDIYFDMTNLKFESMCGFRVGSIQGYRLFDDYPNYGQEILSAFQQAMLKKEKSIFVMQQPNTDYLYEVICYPQKDNRFFCITNDVTERIITERKLEEQHRTICDSIDYARKIQKNLLPKDTSFKEAFSDFSVIWKPRDVVGGDIYWIKTFTEGTVLCICDCTGHGTPGAMLTMLVVSAFEDIVGEQNCSDTAHVIWALEQRLVRVFNVDTEAKSKHTSSDIRDGCDIAVIYIDRNKNITISSGNMHVFICDGNEVNQMKGQKIYVGEGRLRCKEEIKTIKISSNPNHKFYIASDGMFDQLGGDPARPFGYKRLKQLILEYHQEKQAVISEKIWEAYRAYQGDQIQRDDVELITFKP